MQSSLSAKSETKSLPANNIKDAVAIYPTDFVVFLRILCCKIYTNIQTNELSVLFLN